MINMDLRVFEAVGRGHPDKVADIISDRAVDFFRSIKKNCSVAIETLVTRKKIILAGEVTENALSMASLDYLRDLIKSELSICGYRNDYEIEFNLYPQSSELKLVSREICRYKSGDQSVVTGFACWNEKRFLNCLPIERCVVKRIITVINDYQKMLKVPLDAKCMVLMEGPEKVREINISMHAPKTSIYALLEEILADIKDVLKYYGIEENCPININEAGTFEIGGSDADTGATNRKLISDAYGPSVTHGGGGWSGKDLGKVDRLGAYYARYICKSLVMARICNLIELDLIYKYGSNRPLINIKRVDYAHSRYKHVDLNKAISDLFSDSYENIFICFNDSVDKVVVTAHNDHFASYLPWEDVNLKVEGVKSYFGKRIKEVKEKLNVL